MTSPAAAQDLVTAISQLMARALEQHGVSPETARATTGEACRELCRYWGGAEHWIPQTYRPARDAEISALAAQGLPIAVVSQRLEVSEATVRRVVRRNSTGLGRDDWVL